MERARLGTAGAGHGTVALGVNGEGLEALCSPWWLGTSQGLCWLQMESRWLRQHGGPWDQQVGGGGVGQMATGWQMG